MKNGTITGSARAAELIPTAVPTVSSSSSDYGLIFENALEPFTRRRVATLDTVQTLTGKTMSSAANSLDATALQTVPVSSSAPTSGNMLSYNGTAWAPLAISATAPATYSGGVIGVTTGSTAGTAAAGNDPRFSAPQRVIVKNSNPGAGEFTSIRAAVLSITDSGPTKPYVIWIFPGVYVENPMTLPSWVRITGVGAGTVVVPASAVTTTPLLSMSSNTAVEGITFNGPGVTALFVDSASNCNISRIILAGFTTPTRFAATTAPTTSIMFNNMIVAPFTTAITIDGTLLSGSFLCSVTLHANIIYGNSSSATGIYVTGPYAELSLASGRITGLTSGTSILLEDTCNLTMQGTLVNLCNNGIVCANVGGGESIRIAAVTMVDITTSTLVVAHPAANGVVNCILDRAKITIDPASNIAINITDPVNIGVAISGELYYNPIVGGSFTEIGEQITKCAGLGLVNGGDIDVVSGTTISIAAGTSYVRSSGGPSNELIKLTWPATQLVLAANTIFYIYVDATGVITADILLPDTRENTPLGRVGTTATGIEFVDPQKYNAEHTSVNVIEIFREVFGAQFASGGILSVNNSRQIAVTNGEYYYSNNEIMLNGLTSPGNFTAYYHVSGVWTRAAATVVDNTKYDNGTNLVTISGGEYLKHMFYTVGCNACEFYFMVYSQTTFPDLNAAVNGNIPTPPNYFGEGIVPIAAVVVQQGNATFSQVIDMRPAPSGSSGSTAAVSDHGNLTGLLDDDHPQYMLVNGSRPMTGNLNLGTHAITNITTANGVVIEAHAARHLPNGADPLTTAAPLTTLTATTPNSVGTANSFARSDHTHAVDQTTFSLNSIGGTLNVSKGGTGATTFTSGNFLQGNGTSAVTAVKAAPAGAVVGTTDTQTLLAKTIDSAANTITITSGALSATNINSVLNQDLRTTASPTFANVTATGVMTVDQIWGYTAQHTLQAGDLQIVGTVGATTIGVGSKTLTAIKLALSGVNTDNTQPNVLGFAADGTTIVKKTNSVDTTSSQTLSNKTLVSPAINIVLNSNNGNADISIPADAGGTDSFLTVLSSQGVLNKGLNMSSCYFYANTGTNRKVIISATIGTVDNTSTTLQFSQTADRTISFPDTSDTAALVAFAQTLSNKTINSAANTITITSGALSAANINNVIDQDLRTTAAPTHSGLTVTNSSVASKTLVFSVSNSATTATSTSIVAAQTANRVLTLPDATGTIALLSQIPTNTSYVDLTTAQSVGGVKTFTSAPVFSSLGSGTMPTVSPIGVAAGVVTIITNIATTDTAQTFTNKTLTAPVINGGSIATCSIISTNTFGAATIGGPGVTFSAAGTGAYTLPAATDTVALLAATQTFTNKTLTAPIIATINNGGILTLPTGPQTLVGRTTTDTLTNKTLTAPVIATIVNVGTLTLPTSTDTLVGRATTDTLTNKTLTAPVIATIVNVGTLTLPTSTDTLVGRATTDTLTNKTLTLPTIASINNGGTLTLPTGPQTLVGRTTTDTLTNKTLTLPVIASISNGGTITIPSGTDTLVGRATTDTLTNKTLTLPVIASISNGGTVTIPTGPETLVGRATTDTLTNKTISTGSNTFTVSAAGGANINSLLNQDVRTTASPTFAGLTSSGSALINGLNLYNTTVGNVSQITTAATTARAVTFPDAAGAVLLDSNTATVSGKSISSGTNVITISAASGTNINSLINQDVRTSAAPSFLGPLSLGGMTTTGAIVLSSTGLSLTTIRTGTVSQTPVEVVTAAGNILTMTDPGAHGSITTGPTSTVVGNIATFSSLTGAIDDSGIAIAGFVTTGGAQTLTNKNLSDSTTYIVGAADATKRLNFNVSGGTTGVTTQFVVSSTTARTITFPNATTTLVGRDTTDTLTNKTLTSPVISTIINTGTITVPTTTGTLALVSQIPTNTTYVDLTTAQNVTGTKTFTAIKLLPPTLNNANTFVLGYNTGTGEVETFNNFVDLTSAQNVGGTKTFYDTMNIGPSPPFAAIIGKLTLSSGGVTGTSTTLQPSQNSNRVITLPDASGTVALTSQIPTNTSYVDLTTAQSVGGVKTFTAAPKFTGLSNQTFPTYVPVGIHGVNSDLQAITNMASTDTAQTLLNKTINTTTNAIQVSSAGSANLTTLLNQAVLTTSTPTFANLLSMASYPIGMMESTSQNGTATTISVINTFVQIAGTWTASAYQNGFTYPSNGVMQYGGSTRRFMVSYTASVNATATFNFSVCVYLNGSAVNNSTSFNHTHLTSGRAQATNSFLMQLTSGDQLTLRIANNTATSNITVAWYNLMAAMTLF